jgi:hypothetical protein
MFAIVTIVSMTPKVFAQEYELPVESVRAALAYAASFPDEIENDIAHAEANRMWLENQQAADFAPRRIRRKAGGKNDKHKVAG